VDGDVGSLVVAQRVVLGHAPRAADELVLADDAAGSGDNLDDPLRKRRSGQVDPAPRDPDCLADRIEPPARLPEVVARCRGRLDALIGALLEASTRREQSPLSADGKVPH
jgi:hypothetical protein